MIHFYAGVNSEDTKSFLLLLASIREFNDKDIRVFDEWDDPNGYYTFRLYADFDVYTMLQENVLIKSLEYYED